MEGKAKQPNEVLGEEEIQGSRETQVSGETPVSEGIQVSEEVNSPPAMGQDGVEESVYEFLRKVPPTQVGHNVEKVFKPISNNQFPVNTAPTATNPSTLKPNDNALLINNDYLTGLDFLDRTFNPFLFPQTNTTQIPNFAQTTNFSQPSPQQPINSGPHVPNFAPPQTPFYNFVQTAQIIPEEQKLYGISKRDQKWKGIKYEQWKALLNERLKLMGQLTEKQKVDYTVSTISANSDSEVRILLFKDENLARVPTLKTLIEELDKLIQPVKTEDIFTAWSRVNEYKWPENETLASFVLTLKNLYMDLERKLFAINPQSCFSMLNLNFLVTSKIIDSTPQMKDGKRLREVIVKNFNPWLSFNDQVAIYSKVTNGDIFRPTWFKRSDFNPKTSSNVFWVKGQQAVEAPNAPVSVNKVNKFNYVESQKQQFQPRRANNTSYNSFPTNKGKEPSLFQILTEEQLKDMDYCIGCESVGHHSKQCEWGPFCRGLQCPPS